MSSRYIIENVVIFDGTGATPFPGAVVIAGNRIEAVARSNEGLNSAEVGADRIDGGGGLLMPGLVEGHAHLNFGSTVTHRDNARAASPAKRMLLAAHAATTLLDHGFTSAYSGGSIDAAGEVALRDAIEAGVIAGPRLRACSFEKSASDPGMDLSTIYSGIDHRASDVLGIRTFVENMIATGIDSIKFVLTGESGVRPGTSRIMQFFEEEVATGARMAHEAGIWLNCHAHSAEAVKMAVRHGFRGIFHATWADDEGIDMLAAHADRLFVAPSPGINWANINEGPAFGITNAMAAEQEQYEALEQTSKRVPEMLKRGIRVIPGGDYGFPHNPVGKNARDLWIFTEYYGMSPAQVLKAATQWGGELMGHAGELGLIREGWLADLLVIDGDPLADLAILQDRTRIALIMKNGRLHRNDFGTRSGAADMAGERDYEHS